MTLEDIQELKKFDFSEYKKLLNEYNISHREIAESIGISRPTVTKILNNIRTPKAIFFLKVKQEIELKLDIIPVS